MKAIRTGLLAAALGAFAAGPVSAGITPDWSVDPACGGTNFYTCMSVDVFAVGNTIVVDVMNLTPYYGDILTKVGLFYLPVGVSPTDVTTSLQGWSAPASGISGNTGTMGPNSRRYAIGTDQGTNGGLHDGQFGSFTFIFDSSVSTAAFVNSIGVVGHLQGGPNGCSTKVGAMANGVVNPLAPSYLDDSCIPVPEPGSMALLAAGAVGMAFIARRRRNGAELVDEDGNDIEI